MIAPCPHAAGVESEIAAAWPARRGVTRAGVLLSALLGMLAGAAGFTFRYAEGAAYLSDNPDVCINCHIMREQYEGWQKAGHHPFATCNDCHVPHDLVGKYKAKAVHGYRHSKAFTLQDFHEPIRITDEDREIVEANCARCHAALVSDIIGHGGSAASGEGGSDCVHCHINVGHGPTR